MGKNVDKSMPIFAIKDIFKKRLQHYKDINSSILTQRDAESRTVVNPQSSEVCYFVPTNECNVPVWWHWAKTFPLTAQVLLWLSATQFQIKTCPFNVAAESLEGWNSNHLLCDLTPYVTFLYHNAAASLHHSRFLCYSQQRWVSHYFKKDRLDSRIGLPQSILVKPITTKWLTTQLLQTACQ